MIRKLRLKFVVINVTIASILLAVILGLTYCLTRTRLETESARAMQAIAAAPFRQGEEKTEQLRLPCFTVRLSPEGEKLAVGGDSWELSGPETDRMIRMTLASDRRIGVLPEYHLRYCRVIAPHSQYLVFADISSEEQTLRNLAHICIAIGILGAAGFLGASIALSGWAVRPVERAFQNQRQFVADASHELKTPLTVIKTNAQLLEQFPEDPGIRERSTENILTMSDRMKNLIEALLTLAKTDHGEAPGSFGPVDLSRMTEKAVLPFEPVFFEAGLELITELQPGIRVKGREDQLRQVLEILLDNARKYAAPGGKTWVRLTSQGKHRCRLTVANQGPPIAREDLDRFFERFTCGDPSRNRGDSFGLGLAIARSIAKAHGARLWGESENGINSFCLELEKLT